MWVVGQERHNSFVSLWKISSDLFVSISFDRWHRSNRSILKNFVLKNKIVLFENFRHFDSSVLVWTSDIYFTCCGWSSALVSRVRKANDRDTRKNGTILYCQGIVVMRNDWPVRSGISIRLSAGSMCYTNEIRARDVGNVSYWVASSLVSDEERKSVKSNEQWRFL